MNSLRKNLNILTITLLVVIIFTPLFSLAQETQQNTPTTNRINYQPLAPLPGVSEEGVDVDTTDLGPYLSNLFNFFVGLAAILAVFIIALGGFLYISSDSFTGKSTGKDFIWNAIQGLLIVLAAFIILYTINPDLLDFEFRPSERDLPAEGPPGTNTGGE